VLTALGAVDRTATVRGAGRRRVRGGHHRPPGSQRHGPRVQRAPVKRVQRQVVDGLARSGRFGAGTTASGHRRQVLGYLLVERGRVVVVLVRRKVGAREFGHGNCGGGRLVFTGRRHIMHHRSGG